MAELTTLARPYAKAAFEFAVSAKALQAWSDALNVAAAVSKQEKVGVLLLSPGLTAEQKAASFIELCGKTLDVGQQNFMSILAENRRLSLLPEVSKLFDLFKANQEKSVDVDIQSAFKISSSLEKKLAKALAKMLEREVSLQTSVDQSLLGGAIIRAGDTVIDGSVRGRLRKLAEIVHG